MLNASILLPPVRMATPFGLLKPVGDDDDHRRHNRRTRNAQRNHTGIERVEKVAYAKSTKRMMIDFLLFIV